MMCIIYSSKTKHNETKAWFTGFYASFINNTSRSVHFCLVLSMWFHLWTRDTSTFHIKWQLFRSTGAITAKCSYWYHQYNTIQYNTIFVKRSGHTQSVNQKRWWLWTVLFHAAVSCEEQCALKLRCKWARRVNRMHVRFEWVPYSWDRHREGSWCERRSNCWFWK